MIATKTYLIMKGDVNMTFSTNYNKGGKNMYNNYTKEEGYKNQERRDRIKDGFKTLAVVGIGAGLYGYRLGRRSGYSLGVKEGHVEAVNEMISAWKDHTEILLKSTRGE